jgi:hypothetical protein
MTLTRSDFIRVPLPAARISAATFSIADPLYSVTKSYP